MLYVDSEPNNLVSFKACLRYRYRYKVFLAQSVSHARDILNKHEDIRIVFSDQQMPEMSGVSFFELLQGIYPQAVRILVDGCPSQLGVLEDAINRANVFRYMKKPWKTEALLRTIADASQFFFALFVAGFFAVFLSSCFHPDLHWKSSPTNSWRHQIGGAGIRYFCQSSLWKYRLLAQGNHYRLGIQPN